MESAGRTLDRLAARIRRCTLCDLSASRTHAVPGEGAPGSTIFLVGEGPGRDEDRLARPFVGSAGTVLTAALLDAGIPRERTFITSTVKCRPPGNRRPHREEIAACRPYLLAQIGAVRPKVIVAMGLTAIGDLVGPATSITTARHQSRNVGRTPVLATYHPAAVLYNRRLFPALVADLRKARQRAEAS